MTISSTERKTRAILPLVRFLQTSIPLPLARLLLKLGIARVKLAGDVTREPVSTDGVPCQWILPPGGRPDLALLYLHGGGFVYGLTPLHLQMGAYLAQKMGLRMLMVDYRLAPDHPFPAALDDCLTAYRWLLKKGLTAHNIAVAGDSAGANLSITMMMELRDSGDMLPAAVACLSPVTDLSTEKTPPEGFKDPLLPSKAVKLYNRSYVGDNDPRSPLISPVFGDLHGLPPLLVHAGEEEILLDDARRITRLAESAGVDVRLEVYSRMWHVWQLFLGLPQAQQSLSDISQFLQSHLEGRDQPSSPG
jgi:monoterpene epsilon-lactone hydrolase